MYHKRLLLMSVVLFSTLSGLAQSKINLAGKAELKELKFAAKMKGTDTAPSMIEAIVTFNDGWDRNIFNQLKTSPIYLKT